MNLLSKIDITKDAVEMEVLDLNGNPLTDDIAQKPFISIYGTDSDVFREAIKELADEEDDKSIKLLSKVIAGWKNIKGDDNMPLEFNQNNALALLKRYPALATQIDVFLGKRANFLKKQ